MFHAENAKVFHGFPLKKPREVMAKTGKASKAEGASEVRRAAAVWKKCQHFFVYTWDDGTFNWYIYNTYV